MGWGFEKKVKLVSHFGLKPGSEITFVNEKISEITRPVSVKLKPRELKPVKLTSSTLNVTAVQDQ